jgi:hypothetical protein
MGIRFCERQANLHGQGIISEIAALNAKAAIDECESVLLEHGCEIVGEREHG